MTGSRSGRSLQERTVATLCDGSNCEASTRLHEAAIVNPQNPNPSSPCPSPSPSPSRLWRPAAQRNLRNQWSKLLSSKNHWLSAASQGRSRATSLVNAYLSQRYMPDMDLGALRDMPGIRQKASEKLSQKQEVCRRGLLSSYKDMVSSVSHMVKASNLMQCFVKGSAVSHLVQFCDHPEDINDPGDGGGLPVFSFLSVPNFEFWCKWQGLSQLSHGVKPNEL